MKIGRTELLDALSLVQPGLAAKEVIEQSQSFVFKGKRVYTYNDRIALSTPSPLDIEGAVKAAELLSLLSKSKVKEYDIEITDNEFLLKSRKSKAGIRLEAEISLPLDEISQPTDWTNLPKRFCEALKFCLFSAGTDMSKEILTCLHIKGRHVTSCDNFRITRYDMGKSATKQFPDSLLIPATAVRELLRYEPLTYCIFDGWIHFRMENGAVFSCRSVEQKYPDMSKYMEVEGESVEMPKRLAEALDRASIFVKTEFEQDEQVELSLKEGNLQVNGEGDSGWFKERIKIEYDGEPVRFHVNPQFLMETLDLLHEMTIGEDKLRLEGENFVHVVNLLVG